MAAQLALTVVREGTDPPATDVVPNRNLTAIGTLDWLLAGQSAVGDRTYKAGAAYITSFADIGAPVATRYGGSNDKQATLASYTDGDSPASGNSGRAWIGTAITSAGWKATIALGGARVRVKLGTGAYNGSHRVACSLSDASASSVSSDQVSGSLAVGWWLSTIVAEAAANPANLVIDLTQLSGAGNALQFMWMTVESAGFTVTKTFGITGSVARARNIAIARSIPVAGSVVRTRDIAVKRALSIVGTPVMSNGITEFAEMNETLYERDIAARIMRPMTGLLTRRFTI